MAFGRQLGFGSLQQHLAALGWLEGWLGSFSQFLWVYRAFLSNLLLLLVLVLVGAGGHSSDVNVDSDCTTIFPVHLASAFGWHCATSEFGSSHQDERTRFEYDEYFGTIWATEKNCTTKKIGSLHNHLISFEATVGANSRQSVVCFCGLAVALVVVAVCVYVFVEI